MKGVVACGAALCCTGGYCSTLFYYMFIFIRDVCNCSQLQGIRGCSTLLSSLLCGVNIDLVLVGRMPALGLVNSRGGAGIVQVMCEVKRGVPCC